MPSSPARALLACTTVLAACGPPHYDTTTVIRYRDASALRIVPPALAPARVVDDSDKSETEYSVQPIRMSTGGPGLKWATTATLASGDETPVMPRPERRCADPTDTEHCSADDPTPAAGTGIELQGETAARTIRGIIVPRLHDPSLALPACAYLRPVYDSVRSGRMMVSRRGVGFATEIDAPCDRPMGISFEVESPWANVLEVTTSRTINHKRARSSMWIDLIAGSAFLLISGGGIAIGASEHGTGRITAITVSTVIGLPFAIGALAGAAQMYSAANAKDQTTVIYPPGAP